mmetsp:Transcript_18556/g.49877  ORF Transcript_18556/g.49877 Transcript_18556/m.49877 type:complete len:233 (-) Transcript_18556:1043-1741(-)
MEVSKKVGCYVAGQTDGQMRPAMRITGRQAAGAVTRSSQSSEYPKHSTGRGDGDGVRAMSQCASSGSDAAFAAPAAGHLPCHTFRGEGVASGILAGCAASSRLSGSRAKRGPATSAGGSSASPRLPHESANSAPPSQRPSCASSAAAPHPADGPSAAASVAEAAAGSACSAVRPASPGPRPLPRTRCCGCRTCRGGCGCCALQAGRGGRSCRGVRRGDRRRCWAPPLTGTTA